MLAETVHHAAEGGFLDELTGLLRNPAHWVFEGLTDVVFTVVVAWPIAAIKVRRHDRKHHIGHTSDQLHASDQLTGYEHVDGPW